MTIANPPSPQIVCVVTGKSVETTFNADGTTKLPRGWKRHEGQTYSPQGWRQQYVPRSMRLPIASVVLESATEDREGGWKAFWAALRSAWGDATRYANLCLSHFAAKDFAVPLVKAPDGKLSLPKIEQEMQNAWRREVYALHHDFPAIDATTAAAIALECWNTWKKWRWDVRITGKRSLPTFRFPLPLPMPAQGIRWSIDAGNGWTTMRIRVNGQAFLCRLSASHKYNWAAQTVRQAIAESRTGEVSMLLRDNQPWVAISVNVPKRPRGMLDPDRTLAVKMGGGDLFRAVVADAERVWTLHADDFLPRVSRWDEQRQRISDDRKFERRRGKSRQRYQAMSDRRVHAHHDWLTVQLHRRSRELVEFARRNGCGRIEIGATPIPGLPNHVLLERIRQKADEAGMIVRVVGDEPEPPASATVMQ